MAKFCTNCGKEINEGADFCLNCGAGPQYSANVQGTICPKCGSNEMSQYKNQFTNSYDKGNKYKCDRCNHIIDIRRR